MVGAISLYDSDGERQHTIYFGEAPEYGKACFKERYEREIARVKARYPDALYLGIADGAKDMRWKAKGAKVVLSLRALVQTTNRWQQFWDKINQFGADVGFA